MAIEDGDIERFASLFTGNRRSFGQYLPNAKKKQFTITDEYTREHIRSHLEGHVGLGISPITDDNKCLWAVIDIDIHGPNGQAVDLEKIEAQVERDKLPLIVCRSKGGGAHVYLFLKEPTEAARVRMTLHRWTSALGFPTAEIFPKQVTLDQMPTDVERPLGSWVNLPYYNAHETNRWALDGGKQVTFDYFLSLAEGKRIDLHEYEHGADVDYTKGPPCLQEILKNRIEEGNRNTAVFQAAVYLKRAFSSDWKSRLVEFNTMALVTPLAQQELRTIMGSVHKRDYQYKCREEPCRSFCNKEACKKREFGITDKDASANEIPLIDKVEKVISTPIRWDLTIKGQVVSVSTGELFNYEAVRQKVGEALHLVLPRLKNQEWDLFLQEIMGKVEIREEMTVDGLIFTRLCDFLRRARRDKETPEEERRDELRRGMPAYIRLQRVSFKGGTLEKMGDSWHFAFKMMDFIEWLKRKKAMPVPDHMIHTHLSKLLGEDSKRAKMRVGNSQIGNVWVVPEESVDEEAVPEKHFKAEF